MPVKKAIFDKKNILVIGGAGFVGSHLCDELVKENKVICIDDFSTGSGKNIEHLLQNPNFRFINHNIVNPISLETLPELEVFKVKFQGVQEIYFLASPTSPATYSKMAVETLLVNSVGLRHALDIAVKYKAQLLFGSSPAVYGQTTDKPTKESFVGPVNHLAPRSVFAEAKRFGEALVDNYRKAYGVDARIARIFNCYGTRVLLGDGRMVPEMIKSAINNRDIVIYGKKGEPLSLFYISDLIRGMMKFMESSEVGPINLASEWKVKMEEVAKKIIEITGSTSKIVYQEKPSHFDIQPLADISLAKEKLGWFPIILMDEGFKKTIDYLSAQQGIREVPLV